MMRCAASFVADAMGQMASSLARLTVIALFVITFVVQPSQIPTGSMIPTLLVGDFVLVNKQVYADPGHFRWLMPYRDPRRDDIIVFHYPIDPTQLLVKRVIAVPGDRVHLHEGQVVLNGQALKEPFALYTPTGRSPYRDEFPNLQRADPAAEATWWIELRQRIRAGDLPIPAGRYFAMGDNRNNSQDSRFWGLVPRNSLVGDPFLIYLSTAPTPEHPRGHLRFDRIGRIVR